MALIMLGEYGIAIACQHEGGKREPSRPLTIYISFINKVPKKLCARGAEVDMKLGINGNASKDPNEWQTMLIQEFLKEMKSNKIGLLDKGLLKSILQKAGYTVDMWCKINLII